MTRSGHGNFRELSQSFAVYSAGPAGAMPIAGG